MSFDAWLVGFGLSRVISQLGIVSPALAFQLLTLTAVIDAVLLKRFFSRPRKPAPASVATGYLDSPAVPAPS
jgi:membrane protein implicated in regulation of membrane protease activity